MEAHLMLLRKPLDDCGDIRGTIYDFEKSGDILPKHNHDENSVHITIVARGRFKVYSHDWEMEATTGQVLNFQPNHPHEFMALEDNSRIVNILKKHGGVVSDSDTYDNQTNA
jgi:quercetin dioxygenase-like cupin family protein